MLISLSVSIFLGFCISAAFVFFAPTVVSIFISGHSAAGTLAASGLPYYASGFVFMAVNICIVGYYQSIERAGMAVLLTLLRGVFFLVAAFIAIPAVLGIKCLWLAIPTAELMTLVVIIACQIRVKRS